MNARHQQFINEYIACHFNATEAYSRAYPNATRETARRNGHELLTNTDISAEIQQRISDNAMSANEVLSRLGEQARAAYAPYIKDDLTIDGQKLVEDGKAHLIKAIKYTETGRQNIEFHDAQAALRDMGRHHKLFTDRSEVTRDIELKDADAIADRLVSKFDSLAARIGPPTVDNGVGTNGEGKAGT